jgi:hypothetical protein
MAASMVRDTFSSVPALLPPLFWPPFPQAVIEKATIAASEAATIRFLIIESPSSIEGERMASFAAGYLIRSEA